MTLPDIALLQTGYLYFHPAQGEQKSFALIDFSRAKNVMEEAKAKGWNDRQMVERVTLYCCTVCPDEDSQTRGALMLYPVTSKGICILEFRTSLWKFVLHAAPIKLTRLLVAQSYEPEKQELLDFLRFQTATVLGFNSSLTPNQICADSMTRTARQLEDSGLSRNFTPFFLGGSFDCDANISNLTRMRMSIEDMIDSPRAAVSLPKTLVTRPLSKKRKQADMPVEDFCRKRNALYSRRMYHKRKLALLSVEEEVKMWGDRNAVARDEHQRLQGLLVQARAVLNAHGLGCTAMVGWVHHQIAYPPEAIAPILTSQQLPQQTSSSYGLPFPVESSSNSMPGFDDDIFDSGVGDAFDMPFESFDEIMFS